MVLEAGELSKKRFSITLDDEDYERLRSLAYDHRPQLSIQYVAHYAIRQLLERIEDPQLALQLRDPLTDENAYGR